MRFYRTSLPSGHRVTPAPRHATIAFALALAIPAIAPAQSQDTFTPMPLDAGFGQLDSSAPAIPPG